jgi:membrane-bound serine protease (ClpP class)
MARFTAVHRRFLGLTLILLGAIAAACGGSGDAPPGRVHVLTWDGIVNPVMERYIDRGISDAEESQAAAVVLRLDTPGGVWTRPAASTARCATSSSASRPRRSL